MSIEKFTNMIGVTMSDIAGKAGDDEMRFVGTNGKNYTFLHHGSMFALKISLEKSLI